jgi:hypothetical protein
MRTKGRKLGWDVVKSFVSLDGQRRVEIVKRHYGFFSFEEDQWTIEFDTLSYIERPRPIRYVGHWSSFRIGGRKSSEQPIMGSCRSVS